MGMGGPRGMPGPSSMRSPNQFSPMGQSPMNVNPFHDPKTPHLTPHSNAATDGGVSAYDPYEIAAEYAYDPALSSPPPKPLKVEPAKKATVTPPPPKKKKEEVKPPPSQLPPT